MSRRSGVALATAVLAAVGATGFVLTAAPSQAASCAGYVGLTFDDGPNASGTTSLLSALTTAGVRATLFNIGQNAANNLSLVQAEVAAGMWIGNHTWSHADMVSLTTAQMDAEISQTQAAVQAGGAPAPTLFRPPYGNTNATLKAEEEKYGLTAEVLWDIDTRDWSGVSTAEIVSAASTAQDGQVILMHDGFPNTVAAIPQILADLGSRGLCAGMISTTTGRAVAPDGSTTPPTSTPPTSTPPTSTPPTSTPPTSTPPTSTPPTSTPPTSTPPTSTPPTSMPPTSMPPTNSPPASSGGCLATYTLASRWTGGFQASVTIASPGTSMLNGWTVQLTLPGGQSISSLWNGVNTGTSGTVAIKNVSYNGTVAAGASTAFGYTGTGDGSLTPTNISCTSP